MITHKEILQKVEYLKKLTGLNLQAEYASCYGGWRLIAIGECRAHRGCFDRNPIHPRQKAKEFNQYITGLIAGVVYQKYDAHSEEKNA
jgi:hypothetical protein